MNLKLDVKLLLTLFVIVATLGGFYYTTQLRLDLLEKTISEQQEVVSEVNALKKQVVRLHKKITRLEDASNK
jgi:Tfp pilus assembly protein PilN